MRTCVLLLILRWGAARSEQNGQKHRGGGARARGRRSVACAGNSNGLTLADPVAARLHRQADRCSGHRAYAAAHRKLSGECREWSLCTAQTADHTRRRSGGRGVNRGELLLSYSSSRSSRCLVVLLAAVAAAAVVPLTSVLRQQGSVDTSRTWHGPFYVPCQLQPYLLAHGRTLEKCDFSVRICIEYMSR